MLRDDDPRGTVEEMTALRVNLAKYGSCSRKVIEDGQLVVRGCPERKRCQLPEKDGRGPKTSGFNGAGPCNKGLEVIKKSATGDTKVLRVSLSCFHIPGFVKRLEVSGGIVEVVASEGEVIKVRGSKVRDEIVPGEGVKRFVDDMIIEETVAHFPRPGTKNNLPEQALVVEVTERIRAEKRAGRPAKLLAVGDDGEPRTDS